MKLPPFTHWYERWIPVIARVLLGLVFLMSAFYKIPGTESFAMEVGMTGAAGVPLPMIAVLLAFLLEASGGIALVIGWHARTFAFPLAMFSLLLGFVFYHNVADQATMGMFISCVTLMAGLLYVSVYGAQHAAVKKDCLPDGLTRGI